MFYDLYQATVDAPPGLIREAILDAGLAHSCENLATGARGYKQTMRFLDPAGDSHLLVFHGSSTSAPSVKSSGVAAEPVSAFLRQWKPEHSVSRVDVAQDFSEPGGFRRTCRSLKFIAKQNRVTSGLKLLPTDPEKGMTQYVGSPTSDAMVRAYEKHKELLKRGLIAPEQYDPHAYRVEIQIRPNKAEEKKLFSRLDHASMLGYSPWVRQVALKHFGVDSPAIERVKHVASETDVAFEHALFQMRKMFRRKAVAENNRAYGLVNPTNEQLADILQTVLSPRLLDLWDQDDEKEAQANSYRPPEERGKTVLCFNQPDPEEDQS